LSATIYKQLREKRFHENGYSIMRCACSTAERRFQDFFGCRRFSEKEFRPKKTEVLSVPDNPVHSEICVLLFQG